MSEKAEAALGMNTQSAEQPGEKDKKAALKKDKQYKKGKRIYALGTWLLIVYLLLFVGKNILSVELIVGGIFITSYLYILVAVPIALMVIGLIISDKAAKGYEVDENNKPWIALMSAAGVVMIALAVFEMVMPSYRVYDITVIDNSSSPDIVRPSQELVAAQFCSGTIFSPAPAEMPGYHYLDVYGKYGILAVKKASAVNNNGKYYISKGSGNNDYTLKVTSLGRDEQFKITY